MGWDYKAGQRSAFLIPSCVVEMEKASLSPPPPLFLSVSVILEWCSLNKFADPQQFLFNFFSIVFCVIFLCVFFPCPPGLCGRQGRQDGLMMVENESEGRKHRLAVKAASDWSPAEFNQ